MSEVIDSQPAKQSKPTVQPAADSQGHPVREWIDTLLQAAVIAKDKQKKPALGEVQVLPPTAMATTNAVIAPTAAASGSSEPIAPVAADAIPSKADKEAEDKVKTTTVPEAKNAPSMTKADAVKTDDGAATLTSKRYRRRRCEVEGCTKFARFNNACSGHGGRRLCAEAGCERVAQFGHKCSAHGGVKLCSIEGCHRAVQSRGCCKTHGGGVRCQHPDCTKGAISKGFCRSHGGGSRCAEQDCQKWAQRHGYCVRHSKSATEVNSAPGQPAPEPKADATDLQPPLPNSSST